MADHHGQEQAFSVHLIGRAERLLIDARKVSIGRIDADKPILLMEEMLLLMHEQHRLIVEIAAQITA